MTIAQIQGFAEYWKTQLDHPLDDSIATRHDKDIARQAWDAAWALARNQPAIQVPSYRLNADKSAIVAPAVKYLPIDENTPLGVRLILADEAQGIGYIRAHHKGDGFTHWHPLPVWEKEKK